MNPGSELIPELELHHFSEIDRDFEVPGLEKIPESEPFMGLIPITVPIPRKNGIITPLIHIHSPHPHARWI